MDFTSQNGAKMPPKTSWKSMSISKGYVFKKPRFSIGKTMILVVLEAQLRTAKRSQDRPRQAKTDQDKTRQDKTGF